MPQGDYVRLSVSDTGHVSTTRYDHIYRALLHHQGTRRGNGLGLPTVYGIIAQSDGHIDVRSEPGKGSVFTIFLPRAEKAEPAKTARAPVGEARRGTETVLVVEDEDVVRSLICHVLELHGYTVLAARNGTEALSIHERHDGNIDIAVVDLVMPGLSGTALAGRLRQAVPHIKVLFISGYTDRTIHDLIADEKNAAFLQKPFKPDELVSKLRRYSTVEGA